MHSKAQRVAHLAHACLQNSGVTGLKIT